MPPRVLNKTEDRIILNLGVLYYRCSIFNFGGIFPLEAALET